MAVTLPDNNVPVRLTGPGSSLRKETCVFHSVHFTSLILRVRQSFSTFRNCTSLNTDRRHEVQGVPDSSPSVCPRGQGLKSAYIPIFSGLQGCLFPGCGTPKLKRDITGMSSDSSRVPDWREAVLGEGGKGGGKSPS